MLKTTVSRALSPCPLLSWAVRLLTFFNFDLLIFSRPTFSIHDLRSECFWDIWLSCTHVTPVVRVLAHSHTNCLSNGTGGIRITHGRSKRHSLF